MNGIDRSTTVKIFGEEYRLVMTTAATREIISKYGGLENIGDALEKEGAGGIGTLSWLIALLANQGIRQDNFLNGTQRKELTPEIVELLTTPADIAEMQTALMEAFKKGSRRDVQNGEPKN